MIELEEKKKAHKYDQRLKQYSHAISLGFSPLGYFKTKGEYCVLVFNSKEEVESYDNRSNDLFPAYTKEDLNYSVYKESFVEL